MGFSFGSAKDMDSKLECLNIQLNNLAESLKLSDQRIDVLQEELRVLRSALVKERACCKAVEK